MTSLQHIVLVFSPIFSTSNGFLFGAGSGQKMRFDGYAPLRRHSKAADSMIPIYERSEGDITQWDKKSVFLTQKYDLC